MSVLNLQEWQNAVSADDAGTAGEWLAACRASGEMVDLSQLPHIAVGRGAAKIVKLLLDGGARPSRSRVREDAEADQLLRRRCWIC
jgi:hypothetical protein